MWWIKMALEHLSGETMRLSGCIDGHAAYKGDFSCLMALNKDNMLHLFMTKSPLQVVINNNKIKLIRLILKGTKEATKS